MTILLWSPNEIYGMNIFDMNIQSKLNGRRMLWNKLYRPEPVTRELNSIWITHQKRNNTARMYHIGARKTLTIKYNNLFGEEETTKKLVENRMPFRAYFGTGPNEQRKRWKKVYYSPKLNRKTHFDAWVGTFVCRSHSKIIIMDYIV